MDIFARNKFISTLLVVLVLVSTATLGVGASPAVLSPQAPESMPGGPPVALRFDPTPSTFRVLPPKEFAQLRIQSATIQVNYLPAGAKDPFDGTTCETWPANAQAAFSYAAGIWESLLNSLVPIKIDACWASMGNPNVLGHSGALSYQKNFTNAPYPNVWYSVSLANALAGQDLDPANADMHITYNKDFSWYYLTDGQTPTDKVDFVSVVLHEICHGLGFSGSMTVYEGQGYWLGGAWPSDGYPVIYDRFAEYGADTSLLSYVNGSAELASALTSNDLYFDGPHANAANGGARPKLYAPPTWKPGSSFSHLDEVYNNTPNALMTYSIGNGESEHSPGPVTMGILRDVGWGQEPDVSIQKQVVDGQDLQPGDPVKFTLTIANQGTEVATSVRVTDTMPSEVLTPMVQSTLALTAIGTTPYVWDVEPLSVGETGIITISGQIDPGLDPDFAFVNTATISASGDNTPGNNSSTVSVGTHEVYLPLIIRCWPLMPSLHPINNPDKDGIYTVSWSWPSCASAPSSYELQGDSDPLFGSPSTFTVSDTSFEAYSPTPGTYYWRGRASGSSQWSNVQSVTVESFSYVVIDNDTGGTLTVEIVGVASQSFPANFYDYWRSVPVGTYTISVQAWCGSATDAVDFPLGEFVLQYWCSYASLSTSMKPMDGLETQRGLPTVTKAPDAVY